MMSSYPQTLELKGTPLEAQGTLLKKHMAQQWTQKHGDLQRWLDAVGKLPELVPSEIELESDFILNGPCSLDQQQQLRQALMELRPWRKGPFRVFGVDIETEWHSDWKWQRLEPCLNLEGKHILDVGCGNGYYMWRMLGKKAASVIGIDPNLLFLCQFISIQKYLPHLMARYLPVTLEELPQNLEAFDVVFSMGVLYHRRSPIDHLLDLKGALIKGGELILETLVIEGNAQQVLVPEDRYAQMRNVWFIPSVTAMELWLQRAGFREIECIDVSRTSVQEQRSTEWMPFQSLPDFLNPENPDLTIENLPAPTRAIFRAIK